MHYLCVYTDAPLAPKNLSTAVLSTGDSTLTVNLTWSQNNSAYVMIYYVEVTADNISMNKTTTQQNIILTLQIGVVYYFRVIGVDSINRGEWSPSFIYPQSKLFK